MTLDIAKLDKQMEFLRRECEYLRGLKASWAATKADTLDGIKETLRQVRQEQSMRGMDGRRIE